MRVLFLLSCLEPAGSETYCVTLARAWEGRHEIFWISDRLHFGQTYTSYPIHKKIFPGGLLNVFRVLRFVRDHRIELIHSHSRRSHWVASHAAALAGIPHVATVHQPPPVHFFSRLSPCLGDATIAVSEAVQEHLEKHFRHGLRKLRLIRNGIELRPAGPREAAGDNKILYLGRLTGGRWRALEFFFATLKRLGGSLPRAQFLIVGRVPAARAAQMEAHLREVNQAIAPGTVETHDFMGNLAPLIAGSRAVIAAGRSALESMAAGKPVIALGEKGVVGLCAEDTWKEAMRTNFGDHYEGAPQFYPAILELGLRQLSDGSASRQGEWGRSQVERYYNIQTVSQEIEALYKEVR
jgi:L-malate glycosyltransferase